MSSAEADHRFRIYAQNAGYDANSVWLGHYVDYEWGRLRHVLESYEFALTGKSVLEFGCNFGASSIILSAFGANVSAVDVDPVAIDLAKLNAERYGSPNISFSQIPKTGNLPFRDEEFEYIICNSVLEYVDGEDLVGVGIELDRVLTPGGKLMVLGTSNRIWPTEVHSGRMCANYVPIWADRIFNTQLQRGISPVRLRNLFKSYIDFDAMDGGRSWLAARAAFHNSRRAPFRYRILAEIGSTFGIGPGWLAPNLSATLCKPK